MSNAILDDMEQKIQKAIDNLISTFSLIRSGKASASIFDRVMVDSYGTPTPLNQVASISTPEVRLILIQPWDKGQLSAIEKAILASDLSLNPNNDGKVIRINLPPLTEERRKALVKQAKNEAEEHRVSIRNARRDTLEQLKKAGLSEDDEKKDKENIQKATDNAIKKVDTLFAEKEKEIMEI
ncbi:ribosome recycling factor [Entomospira culicis]|uniref:Ribosome-recycling factor n=1 Tax=Entomospira culicis TaxID=2719989 RepID=A0A968GII5_9SPIO|nr:ribosome recycling factor [Entomospira culicis]NIZ19496.1 ribosome recycling factor [Entomospira culicis]NIZ69599.1 ribosome recycling factor [Entomospira culicis]WDI36710.1 ribosome recycling factor [Entomospira culicis]WDI38339.1 ribosome recycling factor [Entomospira culicis]